MPDLSADQVYALIKRYEGILPIPVPYVTINVGTFDAAAGTWAGLTTSVTKDPEPIEHLPGQTPKNPPPRYVGAEWISETIDAQWRRTITSTPAPLVAVAPVLLQFTVTGASMPWSVTVFGVTRSAPAGQNRLSINVWDRSLISWTITAGAHSHSDQLHIHRNATLPPFALSQSR